MIELGLVWSVSLLSHQCSRFKPRKRGRNIVEACFSTEESAPLACQRFVSVLSTFDDPVDSSHPRVASIVEAYLYQGDVLRDFLSKTSDLNSRICSARLLTFCQRFVNI